MDFDLSDEQKILRKSARDFLTRECPAALLELESGGEGHLGRLWQGMANLGWMGIAFPEEYGGSGGCFLDLVLLLEEMGYSACPGPFFSTVVLGGLPIMMGGKEEQKNEFLPKIARGEVILTLALTEPTAGFDASSVRTRAIPSGRGYLISGTKLFVPDADLADLFLCVARTEEGRGAEEGITLFLVEVETEGIECTRLETLAKDRQCEVVLRDVGVSTEDILGVENRGWPLVRCTLQAAAVGRCAEMIGGAQRVMEMALAHARERVQFGRPIGGFQAIHGHFADMWVEICGSRDLLYKAAWMLSEGIPANKEVAMAKAKVGSACRRVTALGHQIFGAIGFTMEHPMHLYYRRAMAGELSFGDSEFHKECLARELGL